MPPDINIACGETETLSREIGEIEDQPRKMARTPSRGKRLTSGWRARQSPRYGGDRFGAKAASHMDFAAQSRDFVSVVGFLVEARGALS
jgi:hypothetical protein